MYSWPNATHNVCNCTLNEYKQNILPGKRDKCFRNKGKFYFSYACVLFCQVGWMECLQLVVEIFPKQWLMVYMKPSISHTDHKQQRYVSGLVSFLFYSTSYYHYIIFELIQWVRVSIGCLQHSELT